LIQVKASIARRHISLDEAKRNADSRTDLTLRIRLSERRTAADAPAFTMVEAPPELGRLHHSHK
jgi:hypothetical protein